MNKVKQSDLTGDIADFPIEVVQKMSERQVEQGNKFDPSVFANRIDYSHSDSGFHWSDTDEGHYFWEDVITEKDFDLFFQKYPKQSNNGQSATFYEQEKVMLVSDDADKSEAIRRVVFGEKNGEYLAWRLSETIEEAKKEVCCVTWEYVWELPQTITKEKAEKLLSEHGHNVEIED